MTHPRCVFVLAVDEHQGRPYIVMELMPGTTLQTLVEKHGPLEPADAIAKIFDVDRGTPGVPQARPDPSRRQAVELLPRERGPGQDRRLRPLQVARRRAGPDPDRHVHRHAALRLSRADQAGRGGRADRRLFGGGDALLPADRASAGAGQGRGRGPRADRLGAGTAAPRLPPETSPAPRGRRSTAVWSATRRGGGGTSRSSTTPSSRSSRSGFRSRASAAGRRLLIDIGLRTR